MKWNHAAIFDDDTSENGLRFIQGCLKLWVDEALGLFPENLLESTVEKVYRRILPHSFEDGLSGGRLRGHGREFFGDTSVMRHVFGHREEDRAEEIAGIDLARFPDNEPDLDCKNEQELG